MGRYKWTTQEDALLKLLKEIRKESGLSGPVIQKQLNRPNSYISKVESGEKRLDVLELHDLCSAYGISIADFATRLESVLRNQQS